MPLLQDEDFLELKESIFPLFNHTNTLESEISLEQLFTKIPTNLEEVVYRQDIIKGFIQNWGLLEDFNYQVINFRESYQFCSILPGISSSANLNPLRRKINFWFRKKSILKNRSKLVQFILLFHHLNSRFLGRLEVKAFPLNFQKSLLPYRVITLKLQTERLASLISQNKFSGKEIHHLEQALLIEHRTGELQKAWEALFAFEAYFSIAKGIIKYGFIFPTFQKVGLDVKDFYHPLLTAPVKNSLLLSKHENVVLVTGPNMSGKSILFKSISICVYLAHLGLAVPASACAIPFFRRLSVSINPKDDVSSGYSHFMKELMTLKSVVLGARAGEPIFAVFDELFKGTNADDAQQILLRTISGLRQFKNSYFFISSHLLHLKEQEAVAHTDVKKYHIECQLKEGRPTFTYSLLEGWSEIKIGKILFEQVGLKDLLSEK